MTTDPAPPGEAAARPLFPRSHWRFTRIGDDMFELVTWPQDPRVPFGPQPPDPSPGDVWCTDEGILTWDGKEWNLMSPAVRLVMNPDEAYNFSHGIDRVQSWAAASAEGTFSAGPTPAQAAAQLAICRYFVTSNDLDTHIKLAQAAPWAHWVELVPSITPDPRAVSWRVDVFAADDSQFLQAALTFGVQVTPVPGNDVPA